MKQERKVENHLAMYKNKVRRLGLHPLGISS